MKRFVGVLALCSTVVSGPGLAQIDTLRLGPGDVLTIRVARLPELDREAMIGPDGAIRLAGTSVAVAGQDLDSAQQAIVEALTRETGIAPSFVLVDVAEWRPVAVYGYGLRGGELAWRPGMTIRRAIATVEGRQRDENGPELFELLEMRRAETRVLDETNRLARAIVRGAILRSELAGEPTATAMAVSHGIPDAELERVQAIEAEVQTLRRERLAQQRSNLLSQRASVVRQIESLAEELELQRSRVTLFEEQLAASEVLSARGLQTQDRVSNRQADLMSAQLLVVRLLSERAEAEARQALIDSLIDELGTNWILDLTTELKDVEATATAARNALDLARRELEASDQILGTVTIDPSRRTYVIHRPSLNGTGSVVTDVDAPVLPGDIIEVASE